MLELQLTTELSLWHLMDARSPFLPEEVHRKYSIAQGDTEADNTYLAYNVVVGTSLDTKLASAFAVLEYVLLEAPGAPLKQALQ